MAVTSLFKQVFYCRLPRLPLLSFLFSFFHMPSFRGSLDTPCRGRLQNLKGALPRVAQDYNINVGALANHMAYRLAEQHESWWGAAHNLQDGGKNPFEVARDVLLEYTNLYRLSEFDRALLQRALNDE